MDENFLKAVKQNFLKQIEEIDQQEKYLFVEEQITQAVGDEMDLISNGLESDFLLKLHNRNTFLRKKIFYALKKIDEGTYGSCEECNQKIGMGRLLARPTATLCIQCKEGQEREEQERNVHEADQKLWSTEIITNKEVQRTLAEVKAIRQGEV